MKGGGFDHLKIPHTTNLQFSYGYYKDLDHIFYDKRTIPNSAAGYSFFYSIIFFFFFFCFECLSVISVFLLYIFVFAGLEETLGNSCKDVSCKN